MSTTRTEGRHDPRTTTRSRARVPQRRPAPRHRLLLACVAVLSLGLLGVLLLNTVVSQGAFRQFDLELELIELSEEEERLARAVQLAEAPVSVERRARALGMVPAGSPVFLRLADGAILGEPVPAPAPTGPVSFQDAPGITPTRKPTATPTSTAAPGSSPTPTPAASPSAEPTGVGGTQGSNPWETDVADPVAPAPSSPAPSSPAPSSPAPSVSAAALPAPSPTPSQSGVTP